MAKNIVQFTVTSSITLEHETGAQKQQLKSCDLMLDVSKNLDRSMYIDGKGLPRKNAMKPITNVLIHGLVTNVRHCHKHGWMNEADHMRYIISELQRAFVEPVDVITSVHKKL